MCTSRWATILTIILSLLVNVNIGFAQNNQLDCASQNSEYWSHFTYAYKNAGEYDRALHTYHCWDITGDANEALLAEIHLGMGNMDEVKRIYEIPEMQGWGYPYDMFLCEMSTGLDDDQTLQYCETLINNESHDYDLARSFVALRYHEQGRFQEELELLKYLAENDGSFYDWEEYAIALADLGDFVNAFTSADNAFAAGEKSEKGFYLANYHRLKARIHLAKYKLNKEDSDLNFARGEYMLFLSEAHAKCASTEESDHLSAFFAFSSYLRDMAKAGFPAEAIDNVTGTCGENIYEFAMAYVRAGQPEKALETLNGHEPYYLSDYETYLSIYKALKDDAKVAEYDQIVIAMRQSELQAKIGSLQAPFND